MLCFQSVLFCIVLYNDVFTFLYVAVGNKLLLLLRRISATGGKVALHVVNTTYAVPCNRLLDDQRSFRLSKIFPVLIAAAGVSVASMAQIKPRPVAVVTTQLPADARLPIVGQRQGKMTEYAQAVPLTQYAYEQMYAGKTITIVLITHLTRHVYLHKLSQNRFPFTMSFHYVLRYLEDCNISERF